MSNRRYRPWLPVEVRPDNEMPESNRQIRKADCVAIQAIAAGVANEDQQKRAFAAILHICGTNDLAWMPEEHGGDRDTAFAAGKQHIGFQLRKLATVSLSILTGENNGRREQSERNASGRG